MANPSSPVNDFQQYLDSLSQKDKEELDYLNTLTDEAKTYHRFRRPLQDPLVTGYHYIFMTAPDLAISQKALSLQPFDSAAKLILDQNERKLGLKEGTIYTPDIISWLSGTHGDQFLPIITNRAASFMAADEVMNTMDYSETWNKYKIILGTTGKDSRIAGTMSINLMEDQWTTMLRMHKLWFEYIEKCFIGECISGGVLLSKDLMDNAKRTIDYLVSIYTFSTLPDGETLTHWNRVTGALPTKLPWSEFTSEDGGKQDLKATVNIEYAYTYREEMKLEVLRDFNLLASRADIEQPSGKFYTGSSNQNPDTIKVSDDRPRIIKVPNSFDRANNRSLYRLAMPGSDQSDVSKSSSMIDSIKNLF